MITEKTFEELATLKKESDRLEQEINHPGRRRGSQSVARVHPENLHDRADVPEGAIRMNFSNLGSTGLGENDSAKLSFSPNPVLLFLFSRISLFLAGYGGAQTTFEKDGLFPLPGAAAPGTPQSLCQSAHALHLELISFGVQEVNKDGN